MTSLLAGARTHARDCSHARVGGGMWQTADTRRNRASGGVGAARTEVVLVARDLSTSRVLNDLFARRFIQLAVFARSGHTTFKLS